ncbi:hypothetical protein FHX44_112793 [Pseudonocardia hierapolitana]|uniref:Uncharacterized protein n=1 Tax=Pseudonocardia hierapolitana TaxID=1128676 RepID=A0A561SPV5_9PSEU|nr:hypothetical protein [Pseudonocardia hierapolitana]TWF76895.1 hypothetical protein FHX44_112793 [Pseudonocardia hierapolitana]
MNLAIVLGGLTILVGLAVLIGLIDAHARRAAWRRIAAARREVQERELALLSAVSPAAGPRPGRPGVSRRGADAHRAVGPRGIAR